jgi:hypothetical protein
MIRIADAKSMNVGLARGFKLCQHMQLKTPT